MHRVIAQQQCLGHRHHGSGNQALHQPRRDQHGHAGGQAAQRAEHHEQQVRGDEGAHLAEAATDPARQRLDHRRRQQVGADRPGAFRGADSQAAGDRRDRHIDDGHVENFHETRHADGEAQQHQCAAAQRRDTRPAAAVVAAAWRTPASAVSCVGADDGCGGFIRGLSGPAGTRRCSRGCRRRARPPALHRCGRGCRRVVVVDSPMRSGCFCQFLAASGRSSPARAAPP